MSDNKQHIVEELEATIRLLADIWPNDKENLPEAGAKFEAVVGQLDSGLVQLKKIIDLSWEGLKHLYEKNDFFITVKASTMQAINIIREYIINDGDVKVETFEKVYTELDKALSGAGESADEVIELDEETIQKELEKRQEQDEPAPEASGGDESYTLNDLAAKIMMIDGPNVPDTSVEELMNMLRYLVVNTEAHVAKPLAQAGQLCEQALANKAPEDWFAQFSTLVENATSAEEAGEEITEESTQPSTTNADTEQTSQDDAEVFIISEDVEVGMIGEFVTECTELIELAEEALLDLEERPDDDELINTVFRAFHTIKGTSAFMGLDPISEFTHSVETFLSMVREGDLSFDPACADISLQSIDIINKLLGVVEHAEGGTPLPKPANYDRILRVLAHICDEDVKPADALEKEGAVIADTILQDDQEAAEDTAAVQDPAAATTETQEKSSSKSDSESSVRVSVSRLDRLIDMVGELVIAHSVVAQDNAIPNDSELQKKVNHTTKILRELQDTSLTLRMIPLKATFHKMNRLVRDLSRKAGKQVKFSTFGEDTEIDRNMVDVINEPLIHMIRNSLDHGIEEPAERKAAGKGETAHISLKASQEGGKVVIRIEDDGRGIDKDKILNKAIEKGLVDPDKKLNEKEIYNLIFLPGFSSAEKVTDLSGRGVGMDVVRRSIEQLQGKVEVESELGVGTTIIIELPFTLAITDGMVVRIGAERFIIPTINIDMTFRAEKDDIFTVFGESEQVHFRGKSVPVIRLHRLFEIPEAIETLEEGTLIVIKNNDKKYALLVDEVIGQQQLVGKSINMIAKMKHISGGAIMGDGRVGLILDTTALVA